MVDMNYNNATLVLDEGIVNDGEDSIIIRRRVGDDISHTYHVIIVMEFTISAFLSIIGSTRILLFIFRCKCNSKASTTTIVMNRRDSRQGNNNTSSKSNNN